MSAPAAGFAYVWRYEVRPGDEARFERLYGPGGEWVRLFRGSPDYVGTDLLRGPAGVYVTIDRWTSREPYEAFAAEHRNEWGTLDARGERLTSAERLLGEYDVVS